MVGVDPRLYKSLKIGARKFFYASGCWKLFLTKHPLIFTVFLIKEDTLHKLQIKVYESCANY